MPLYAKTPRHEQGIDEKFLEQWHQKLHTNTTPEDVAICEAYLVGASPLPPPLLPRSLCPAFALSARCALNLVALQDFCHAPEIPACSTPVLGLHGWKAVQSPVVNPVLERAHSVCCQSLHLRAQPPPGLTGGSLAPAASSHLAAFLRCSAPQASLHSGNPDDFWRLLWENHGISRDKLARWAGECQRKRKRCIGGTEAG